jgi:hypothetical protein
MYSARHIFIFSAILVFGPLAIQQDVSAKDTSASIQDVQNTLRLLEECQSQEKRLCEILSERLDKPKTSWLQVSTLVVTSLIAFGGWFFAAYQASQTRKEAVRQQDRDLEEARLSRLEEHLFRSLEFFSGKTQRRSIGIAVVSANWDKFEHLRPTWVSILVSQAIYLLTASTSHKKMHELQNLKEIINILLKTISDISPSDKAELKNAIQNNQKNKLLEYKNGLKIIESNDLDAWEGAFQ